MTIFKNSADITAFISNCRAKGLSIGFVPTMGALHQGHISLIELSKKENSITVCSIFVNPTQFNKPDDFEKYPITIENDIDLLEKQACDVLFLPVVEEVYPPGYIKSHYELGFLETVLEGKYRPGHFQGVCQVVDRFLNIVNPHKLYLGQKDFQQCMVISAMVKLKNLNIQITICPTLREPNGLAMSSRNKRLSSDEKKLAGKIFEALSLVKSEIKVGNLAELKIRAVQFLSAAGFKTDYFEIADASNLTSVDNWDGKIKLVALVATNLNDIRLIDNLVLN